MIVLKSAGERRIKAFFRGELPAAPMCGGTWYKVAKKGVIRKEKPERMVVFPHVQQNSYLTTTDAMTYTRNIEDIIGRFSLMPLDAGAPDPSVAAALDDPMLERLFGGALIQNKTAARLCQAGLWLLAGHLDACHAIVQSVGTADAGYWHAIVHRRGGDDANSLYWHRRAGPHPVFPQLLASARTIAGSEPAFSALVGAPAWEPETFIACCRSASGPAEEACRKIQQSEWRLLFAWCYAKATEEA
jgi:hypothetical protein